MAEKALALSGTGWEAVRISEYVPLNTVLEPPLVEFKAELASLNIFDVINEGEQVYEGTEPWAMVIPGIDRINHVGMEQLDHRFQIYVNILQGVDNATLPELRKHAETAYNKLLEDLQHNDTCFNCFPVSWHPGFMTLDTYQFVGVQMIWEAQGYQTFPLPTSYGRAWTSMEDVVEKIIAEFKDELGDVVEIDEITEGERVYTGEGVVAWVIPASDAIVSSARARFEHNMTIFQNLIAASTDMTFAEMRKIGQLAYDRLMVDTTHDRTCTVCLPSMWHAGFIQFGPQRFVGTQTTWGARILQTYTPT